MGLTSFFFFDKCGINFISIPPFGLLVPTPLKVEKGRCI